MVFVDGRTIVQYWGAAKRRAFGKLIELANQFDLHVHEVPVPDGGRVKKKWTHKRVDMTIALATIHDNPGMFFDDWSKLWMDGAQVTTLLRKEARKKAQIALSKLFLDGKVEKRRNAEDGRLMLFPIGKMNYGE